MGKLSRIVHALWHLRHPDEECRPTQVVTDLGLQRQMLYDSYDNPERVAQAIGMPGIGDDNAEMEARAHKERLEALVPVLPLLIVQSDFLAHTQAVLQCIENDIELDDERAVQLFSGFKQLVQSAVIASVSSAVALGILEINKEVTTDV